MLSLILGDVNIAPSDEWQIICHSIDALIISLQIHQSEKSFNLLSELFSIIGNQEFADKLKNRDIQSETLTKLIKFTPGIIWKNK